MKTVAWLVSALIISADLGHYVRAQPLDEDGPYLISLRNVPPFIPDAGIALDLPEPGRDSDDGSIHALVQLDRDQVQLARDRPELRVLLRQLFEKDPRGIKAIALLRPLQGTTYEAVIRRDMAVELRDRGLDMLDDDVARLIRWIGSVPLDAKLDSALLAGRYYSWGLGPNGTFRLLVTFYEDVKPDVAELALKSVGAVEFEQYTNDTWRVLLKRDQLGKLTEDDSVRLIAQGSQPFRPLNDAARGSVNVDTVQQIDLGVSPPVYGGLTGADVVVAVMDHSVDAEHDDFWQHDVFGHRTLSRLKHHTGNAPSSQHGTHVAGIIGGSGYQSDRLDSDGHPNDGTSYQWRGMAPLTSILSFEKVNSAIILSNYYDAVVLGAAGVSNHSYEKEDCNRYNAVAEKVDELAHGSASWSGVSIPPRATVWAAGNNGLAVSSCPNSGYFGLTTASKNAIIVGAANADTGLRWEESSLGPSYDGRLKPDVVAPGCNSSGDGIISTATSNGYQPDCGTSIAAPVVTGTIALLLQKWREKFCSPDSSGGPCVPVPSTLKAVLIQGATDLADLVNDPLEAENPDTNQPVQYHQGPDYATGYGLINAAASVNIVDAGLGITRRIVESEIFATTDPHEYLIDVPPGAARLRVTLAWDDVAGNASTSDVTKKLVNDLDLELISPAPPSTTFLPWILYPITPATETGNAIPYETDPVTAADIQPAITGVDDVNNVEQVEVGTPIAGTWRVRVKGDKLLYGSTQKFSLATDYAIANAYWTDKPVAIDRPLCVELDWIPVERGIQIAFPRELTCGVVSMEPLCQYVIDCPGCDGFGYCPEIGVNLTHVPETVNVEVRRQDGGLVVLDEFGKQSRSLNWERAQGDKYAIFFVPTEDSTVSGTYKLGISANVEVQP